MSAVVMVMGKAKLTEVKAACCPGCDAMAEENRDGFCPPITLYLQSCNHYACEGCSRGCMDGECSYTACAECAVTCEGCANTFCPEHTVAKCYCAACAPADVLHEANRPAYCFED